MIDATPLFTTYRECARHLWNTYFRPAVSADGDWDLRDDFERIASALFSCLVLGPLDVSDCELAPAYLSDPLPLPGFRIVPSSTSTPILINRDLPPSGYWDYPVPTLGPEDAELQLLRFSSISIN
jgi:hypothetical protein